jgi:4-aminobutyrate aminotransferase-like enzyme
LPDIVTLAKALGSGYSPLGAMLASAEMVDELASLTGFEFQYSYNANPVSCAAGLAVLDEFERLDLVNRAAERGARLRAGLEALQDRFPIIGDIRGLGLLLAVELVADRDSKTPLPNDIQPADRVRVHGLRHGLMIYSRATSGGRYGHWFIVAPPLIISETDCDELLERLEASLRDFSDELRASGIL